ncbi:MAG: hypothetical protein KF784_04630 [Fimbriimonadaceae bacterium]|nr:hypothetical protein [Fimbriimonadaceae bacterium]
MLQRFLETLWSGFTEVGRFLAERQIVILLFFVTIVVAGVALYIADRDRFETIRQGLLNTSKQSGSWTLYALMLLGAGYMLVAIRGIVNDQRIIAENAEYSAKDDPSLGGIYQYGPSAAGLVEKTYTRTLTLPPAFLDRLGSEGIQSLTPYLQDPSSTNILKLSDTFRKSGQDAVFTREVVRMEEQPLPIQNAVVNVDVHMRDAESTSSKVYDVDFRSEFTFRNPSSEVAKVRMTFPLPQQSGLLSSFSFKVGEEPVSNQDEMENYVWEGMLQPGETRTATVAYKSQGGGAWVYNIGSRRRRVEAFTLNLKSNSEVRFQRGGLFPTTSNDNSHTWSLSDIITTQNIELTFPTLQARKEAITKALVFQPAALLLLPILVLWWGWRMRKSANLSALFLGLAGMTLGFASTAVLLGYMQMFLALLVGGFIAAVLAVRAVGMSFIVPVVAAALAPMAFLNAEHSGLLLVIGALALWTVSEPAARKGQVKD